MSGAGLDDPVMPPPRWWRRRQARRACVRAGGHWWQPVGLIDWCCRSCGTWTDGPNPRPGQVVES